MDPGKSKALELSKVGLKTKQNKKKTSITSSFGLDLRRFLMPSEPPLSSL